jgi:hypothetical protein
MKKNNDYFEINANRMEAFYFLPTVCIYRRNHYNEISYTISFKFLVACYSLTYWRSKI